MTGPRKENEQDGPEEMYVILLDNGRSKLLADEVKREALYCILRGACLNACPVYKNIGGHTYGTTYSGPIGSVITPHYKGMEEFSHLSFASSLCGNCTEVCPVRINLHNLLLYNRHESVQKGLTSMSEDSLVFVAQSHAQQKDDGTRRCRYEEHGDESVVPNSWGKHRSMLHFAPKSFHERWMEMHPEK